MKSALLPDRGVVKVAGDDARKFLNGLITSDIAKVAPGQAGFAALLTPQGKIIVDFILAEAPSADGGGFFLDCPRALAPALVQRLNFYKLRAKVIVEDLSETLGVLAIWDGAAATEYGLCYGDPRLPELGTRCMLPPHLAGAAAADLGAELARRRRLRGASDRARGPARRPRFHLQRCVPARDRHGPARRGGFRQGLLRRPGGGLAHRAPRHRAQPHRARRATTALRPRRARR